MHLKDSKNLLDLGVGQTDFNDVGMSRLKNLTRLKSLDLSESSGVTDNGLLISPT